MVGIRWLRNLPPRARIGVGRLGNSTPVLRYYIRLRAWKAIAPPALTNKPPGRAARLTKQDCTVSPSTVCSSRTLDMSSQLTSIQTTREYSFMNNPLIQNSLMGLIGGALRVSALQVGTSTTVLWRLLCVCDKVCVSRSTDCTQILI